MEQTQRSEVARGEFRDRLRSGAADLGQTAHRLHQERRLIAFAAMRNGREIRAIGLDQEAVVGRDARRLADRFGLGKRQHAAETQVEAAIERLARLGRVAGEAVHDARRAAGPSTCASVSSQASRV